MKFTRQSSATLALLAAAAGLVGCASDSSSDTSYGAIVGDLTPELQTTTERPVDVDRNMAVAKNQNWRMMWDDLGRIFYTDHPSRLSPYPIMYTSGVPR